MLAACACRSGLPGAAGSLFERPAASSAMTRSLDPELRRAHGQSGEFELGDLVDAALACAPG